MKKFRKFWRKHGRAVSVGVICLTALVLLYTYHLGKLTGSRLSGQEYLVANTPAGWHGIYMNALYLPMEFVRSAIAWLDPARGVALLRLPNAACGIIAVISFGWLIRLQHSTRTAVLSTLMFATSAYVLHVSRLASYEVLYLMAIPLLLAIAVSIQKAPEKPWLVIIGAALCSVLLTVPGLVWIIAWVGYNYKTEILSAFGGLKPRSRIVAIIISGLWILPLALASWQNIKNLMVWFGLPTHFSHIVNTLEQLYLVPLHLFIRGPHDPNVWLGHAPLLDFFTLLMCVLGIYFYARNWRSSRSRILGGLLIIGIILISLGGAVPLGLLVPVPYIFVATGLAYIIHEWLVIFPVNPIARNTGIGLVTAVVVLSCVYNLRAYFVAWPNNSETKAAFTQTLRS